MQKRLSIALRKSGKFSFSQFLVKEKIRQSHIWISDIDSIDVSEWEIRRNYLDEDLIFFDFLGIWKFLDFEFELSVDRAWRKDMSAIL